MSTSNETYVPSAVAWPAALGTATVLGTLAAACMMPFVGLAVVAGTTMSTRRAALTVATIWAFNQLAGFTLLGYPMTGYAFAWGAALGLASMTAMLIARRVTTGTSGAVAYLAGAFLMAFVAYETLLFGFALLAGGVETFAPAIVLQILINDGLWFVGLTALYIVLTRAAPRWFGPTPALRLA